MDKKRERYRELVRLITNHGMHSPKRHGEYVRCDYIDETYFHLDTYNSSFGLYDKHNKEILHFGIDWGGFESFVSESQLEFYILNLKHELGLIDLCSIIYNDEILEVLSEIIFNEEIIKKKEHEIKDTKESISRLKDILDNIEMAENLYNSK